MRSTRLVATAVAALLASGCIVEVEEATDPTAAFAAARAEAARVQGRPGTAGSLEILAFDRAEGQLVRVSLPMWLVEKMGADEEIDIELGGKAGRLADRVRPHLRVGDLARAGRGVLVEVDEENGDQVLVWLH